MFDISSTAQNHPKMAVSNWKEKIETSQQNSNLFSLFIISVGSLKEGFITKVTPIYVKSDETFDIGRLNLDVFFPRQKANLNSSRNVICSYSRAYLESEDFISEENLEGESFHIDSRRAKLDEPILEISHQRDMSCDKIVQALLERRTAWARVTDIIRGSLALG
ncbi:unnamed protein product [Toxocara canis]|uniref:Pyridoxamine 5'-phosphate oxidase n=1 Tax=Toxocara canis TaxID=6265 RepID=A0A183UCS3_TOXCA|nr:unnamed protein product [Toxocara canis]